MAEEGQFCISTLGSWEGLDLCNVLDFIYLRDEEGGREGGGREGGREEGRKGGREGGREGGKNSK